MFRVSKYSLLCIVFVLVNNIHYGRTHLSIDDECTAKVGGSGVCKLSSSCPEAFIQDGRRVRPTICGFEGNRAVVCCPQSGKRPPPPPIEAPPRTQYTIVFEPRPPQQSSGGSGRPVVVTGAPPRASAPSGPASFFSKTVSQKQCDEYSKVVQEEISALPLFIGADPISDRVPKCVVNGSPLIVGGQEAAVGEFPHMAAIGWNSPNGQGYEFLCGGTLISEDAVLTAAHCTYSRDLLDPVVVRLGEHNLKNSDPRAQPQEIRIKQIILHEDYKPPRKYNDIAVLKLERPARTTNYTRPACLWQKPEIRQNDLVVTGWGHTSYRGKKSDVLRKVSLPHIETDSCRSRSPNDRSLPNGILDTQICAGEIKGGKDSCQGDSGGPLQITDSSNNCIFYVVGITSFGVGCAAPGNFGVNTRVSSYIPWIEKNVWPNL